MSAIKRFIWGRRQKLKRSLLLLGISLIYILPIVTIPGVTFVYLKLGNIKGESKADNYDGWIELDSFNFGVNRGVTTPTGKSGNREATAPSISEITVTKVIDSTSVPLFVEAAVGGAQEAHIHFVEGDSETSRTYLELTLANTIVSSLSQSITAGSDPGSEKVSLNFTKIEMRYTPYDKSGKAGSPIVGGYDISSGKKL